MIDALDEALRLMEEALAYLDQQSASFAAVHLQHAISVARAERTARASAAALQTMQTPQRAR